MAVLLPDKIGTMGAGGYFLVDSKDVEYDDNGTPISLQEYLENLKDGGVTFDDWVAQTEYKVDDLVIQDRVLYKCLVEHTSGANFSVTSETDSTIINWVAIIGFSEEEIIEKVFADDNFVNDTEVVALLDRIFKGVVTNTYSILTSDGKELYDANGLQIVYQETTII